MRNSAVTLGGLTILICAQIACGPGPRGDDGDDGDDGGCTPVCTALGHQECVGGVLQPPVQCPIGTVCDPTLGCTACIPDNTYCVGPDEVWQCNSEGTGGTHVETCMGDLVCANGECQTPCEAASATPSNVGCDFWSVDLDNEAFTLGPISNDAAAQQFAVIIANNNDLPAGVRVMRNTARVGQPVAEMTVMSVDVPARGVYRLNLPQAELDGTMGQNGPYVQGSGSGTFVSPHAYHIVTTLPVVAYQFNPIIQQFSNDASTLIPVQALGTHYTVIGFPTANPCGAPPGDPLHQPSIPDHGSITVVGITDGTQVTVTPTTRIMASGGDSGIAIAQTEAGQDLTFTLNKYDVANLESGQPPGLFECIGMIAMFDGDFTGSIVRSTAPVLVFTSLERGLGLGDAENVPQSPNWNGEDFCCTEHFEEQLFPTTALGKEFAIARSAVRSTDPGWKEPDLYRVLGTQGGTTVTTNLPAPNNQFTLTAGEHRDFASQVGFAMSSTQPVMVAKILVPQQYIPDGFIGDPSFALHPAAEQFRREYVFLVPDTWQDNYMVLSRPQGAAITLDGMPLDDGEFASCYLGPIGMVAGVMYDQITCPLTEGKHTLAADVPFGLMVFGYYSVGAYSFAGGSDVRIINPIE